MRVTVPEKPLIARDEESFFRIVQTTPDVTESIDLLRRAREWALRQNAEALKRGDTSQSQRLAATLTRINDETKYQNEIKEGSNFRKAVRAVAGEEMYQRIISYKAKMLDEKRSERKP